MKIGYARVSSTDQNLARQIKALKKLSVQKYSKKSNRENQPKIDQNYKQPLRMFGKAIRWSLRPWIV